MAFAFLSRLHRFDLLFFCLLYVQYEVDLFCVGTFVCFVFVFCLDTGERRLGDTKPGDLDWTEDVRHDVSSSEERGLGFQGDQCIGLVAGRLLLAPPTAVYGLPGQHVYIFYLSQKKMFIFSLQIRANRYPRIETKKVQ